MSRLPDLERALFDAATRLDADPAAAVERERAPRPARRWRRGATPLLAGLGGLVVVSGALAAATGMLSTGEPVPVDRGSLTKPLEPAAGLTLARVRVPDPDGGPDWGLGTYQATVSPTRSAKLPAAVAGQARTPLTCAVVGRVQGRQLGVVGRDGVFADDGRFHALAPSAQGSYLCGGRTPSGAFMQAGSGPPIPASGYTGAPGTRIGGCRERVDLSGPTVSPQTRRKLKNVPRCDAKSLRQIVAGYAGPDATSITLTGPGYRKQTQKLDPAESGPYLFVLPPAPRRPTLTVTRPDGATCDPGLPEPDRSGKFDPDGMCPPPR